MVLQDSRQMAINLRLVAYMKHCRYLTSALQSNREMQRLECIKEEKNYFMENESRSKQAGEVGRGSWLNCYTEEKEKSGPLPHCA